MCLHTSAGAQFLSNLPCPCFSRFSRFSSYMLVSTCEVCCRLPPVLLCVPFLVNKFFPRWLRASLGKLVLQAVASSSIQVLELQCTCSSSQMYGFQRFLSEFIRNRGSANRSAANDSEHYRGATSSPSETGCVTHLRWVAPFGHPLGHQHALVDTTSGPFFVNGLYP